LVVQRRPPQPTASDEPYLINLSVAARHRRAVSC
jgi:hypothetical protein